MSDNSVNGRKANVLHNGKLEIVDWLSLKVGEIVRLAINDQVPVSVPLNQILILCYCNVKMSFFCLGRPIGYFN